MLSKPPRILVRAGKINKKWVNRILIVLFFNRRLNFNAFKKVLGRITSRVLSSRLKLLENYTFVKKVKTSKKMIRWQYKLTKSGEQLAEGLVNAISQTLNKK